MPTVTIDGKQLEFENSESLLQFCLDRGLELPHFCYHPAMSAPANCRQCLVDVGMPAFDRATKEPVMDDDGNQVINWGRKLTTSCSTMLADGMHVKTHRSSEQVKSAQESNLEFLLINHPLDCPICDQAGQCPLQIQAYKYGPEGSRFEFEKVHKPKKIPLGPRVTLDAERCINCTRCTRFTTEVSKSHQLTITQRGVKNFPLTPPGTVFDDPYSMNVIDICPVGALTSTDARFAARAWEVSSTPSISVDCSKGTNVEYRVRNNQIVEIKPRGNEAVNQYWMPDSARTLYHRFNQDRPAGPSLDGYNTEPIEWEAAVAAVKAVLGEVEGSEIRFIGSARATVEDNYLLGRMAGALGAPVPQYIPHVELGTGDDWLVTEDKAPNAQGCERLGMRAIDPALFSEDLESGAIKVLYVMEEDPVVSGLLGPDALANLKIILHYHNTTNQTLPYAAVALPAATVVETIGTMVNGDGRAQRVRPAKEIRTINRSLMMEMGKSRLDHHGTPFDKWHNEDNKVNCRPSWDLLQEIAEAVGHPMPYAKPSDIMAEIAADPAFAGATYKAMGMSGVQLVDVGAAV